MNRAPLTITAKIVLLFIFLWLTHPPLNAQAAQITLGWDGNSPPPDEYHLYQRQAEENDFTAIWSGTDTSCTIYGLMEGTTYYFVVRASNGSIESDNSNELQYTPGALSATYDSNTDGEGFDFVSPILSQPVNGETKVKLAPALTANTFSGNATAIHTQTRYQISTGIDFSALVFEKTSTRHLTRFSIPDLVLEPDTTYYWRVKFIDQNGTASQWSNVFEFTTIDFEAADDADGNGIPDAQEVDSTIDLDNDGVNDTLQAGLMVVKTSDPLNPFVAVKRMGGNVQIGSILSLDASQLPEAANQPDELTGVISFKLYLLNDAATATVTVFFSDPAPAGTLWHKYDPDEGWEVYEQAVFNNDRKSVTLTLEDGGIGDQDGVRNGIIVDPAGLGYTNTVSGSVTTASSSEGGSSCFIAAQFNSLNDKTRTSVLFPWLSLTGLALWAGIKIRQKKQ